MTTTQFCNQSAAHDVVFSRWRARGRIWILSGAMATGTVGCDALRSLGGCNAVLRYSVDPKFKTLRVGEAFVPNAMVSGCEGEKLSESWSWTTTDSTVLRVEVTTGRTTGVTPGAARLRGDGTPYPAGVEVTITVVP